MMLWQGVNARRAEMESLQILVQTFQIIRYAIGELARAEAQRVHMLIKHSGCMILYKSAMRLGAILRDAHTDESCTSGDV